MQINFNKVLVMGTGRLAFQCALALKDYFADNDIEVVELKLNNVSVLAKLCGKNAINYSCLTKEQIESKLRQIKDITLVVSVVNTYLFKPWFIKQDNITIINYHNALLPLHRGRNAESWAIYMGDRQTGITWHYVDEGVDTGRIIAQEVIEIDTTITALKLLQRQNQLAFKSFVEFIGDLLHGNIKAELQTSNDKSVLHYNQDIPNAGFIDLAWDIDKIYRFLRALDYGNMRILGYPKLKLEDKLYRVPAYRLSTPESVSDKSIQFVQKSGKIDGLQIINGNKCLWLQIE
jgi:methionyl-tRNA formyltransferase